MRLKTTAYFFSIIIPTLNEEKYLPKLLRDLAKQTFFKDKFEVLVIDGHSTDLTKEKAEKFKTKLNLKIITVEKRNVSYQRNYGAAKAKADWILFMDADNRLDRTFLDDIRNQIIHHPSVDLLSTTVKVDGQNTTDSAIEKSVNAYLYIASYLKLKLALGAFIATKRKVLKKVKFDEKMKVYEDSLFVTNAVEQHFHFKIFTQPKWTYSLRRIKKEGLVKTAIVAAKLNLNYLMGYDFSKKNFGYVMEGGNYYKQTNENNLVFGLNQFLRSASKEQLKKAKKLFRKIKDEL